MFNLKFITALYFFYMVLCVTPEENVLEYGPDNFKQKIEEMDGNFIMFYAPWCHQCTELRPVWNGLGNLLDTKYYKLAIAQINCTKHPKLCQDHEITGYPTLLFFHKHSFTPVEYKGTRDLTSLTLFLSEVISEKKEKETTNVRVYNGMAYLTDNNIEKFVSKGQHFIMFFAPWCKASQNFAPVWAELAAQYSENPYIQIGRLDCIENDITCINFGVRFKYPSLLWIANGKIMGAAGARTLGGLNSFIKHMLLAENHDPEKFMKKKKALPVARITEETYETFLEKEFVFIHFFAPWCAHCMQLNPQWIQLGETFQNESRVLIADVDCVRSKPICDIEKINGLPTLILYKNKKVVSFERGGKPLDTLVTLINEHLQNNTEPEEDLLIKSPSKDEL